MCMNFLIYIIWNNLDSNNIIELNQLLECKIIIIINIYNSLYFNNILINQFILGCIINFNL